MPYRSKAQMRLFFAKEHAGELPKGTARRWAKETKDADITLKGLPDRLDKQDMKKEATLFASFLKDLALIKEAVVGVNTSTAMAGVRAAKPKPGKLNVPKRLIIGTARGFDPKASVDGLKNT